MPGHGGTPRNDKNRQLIAENRHRAGKDALTVTEKRFISHYLANGGNATQAAIDAGYCPNASLKTMYRESHRLKTRPQVQAVLKEIEAKEIKGFGDMVKSIIIRAQEIAWANKGDRVPALNLLAKMTPGALVPQRVEVEAKTFPELVLAAQRAREGLPAAPATEPQKDE